jgi:hypothetical protein
LVPAFTAARPIWSKASSRASRPKAALIANPS